MTAKELSTVRELNRELEKDRARLEELEARAAVPELFRRYRGKTGAEGMEELKKQIEELQEAIRVKEIRRIRETLRLWRFADTEIENAYTRLLIELRFVDGESWGEVAETMKGTPESVRKYCYRFLKAHPDLHLE